MTRAAQVCGLAAGALLACLLTAAPPAHAMPVFTEADMLAYSNGENTSPTSCTVAENASPTQVDVPVAENGAPTSLATSSSGTITNNGDASDVISFAINSTTTGRVTSEGGNPGVIELATTGHVQADTSKPTSACEATAFSAVLLSLSFTVAQGGFMTFHTEAARGSYVQIYLADTDDSSFVDHTGYGLSASGVTRVYLPQGTYLARLQANPYLTPTKTAVPSTPVSVSVRASFAVPGSQTTAPAGKGMKYLSFPGARSCVSGFVDAAVTDKGRRAAKIRSVLLFVNDRRVKTVRTPGKGKRLRLPITDGTDADIRAVIALDPAEPGRKPKTYAVTVAYNACP